MIKEFDVIIIGAGVGGLTAGIYTGRADLSTLIIEKAGIGGQILKTDIIENYPAFPEGLSGFELVEKIRAQTERFGASFINGEVIGLKNKSDSSRFEVSLNDNGAYCAKTVIIATGASPKTLDVRGELELTGKGVSYCATCDGPLFRGKEVIVVGGGDSAVGEAIYLSRFAKKVVLVHRRDQLRAAQILQKRFFEIRNAEVRLNSILTEILGSDRVTGVKIKDVKNSGEKDMQASGVFIYVGVSPDTGFVKNFVDLNSGGFIKTDEKMETSRKGIFACGDVRENILKQVVVACAEGAISASSCVNYIESLEC